MNNFDEEYARAELYGLISALFYASPTPDLLAQLRVAVTQAPGAQEGASPPFLDGPWNALVSSCRNLSDGQITQEYNSLFGGVGKPDVFLFGSFYQSGFLNEKPLARLRQDLMSLGLSRDEAMSETEDHIAYLCEVMRYLIAGDDVTVSNLTQQKKLFAAHIQDWVNLLCDAITQHPKAQFYAQAAELLRAFMQVEMQGFDLLV